MSFELLNTASCGVPLCVRLATAPSLVHGRFHHAIAQDPRPHHSAKATNWQRLNLGRVKMSCSKSKQLTAGIFYDVQEHQDEKTGR